MLIIRDIPNPCKNEAEHYTEPRPSTNHVMSERDTLFYAAEAAHINLLSATPDIYFQKLMFENFY